MKESKEFALLPHGRTVTAVSPRQAFAGLDWITHLTLLVHFSVQCNMLECKKMLKTTTEDMGKEEEEEEEAAGLKRALCAV